MSRGNLITTFGLCNSPVQRSSDVVHMLYFIAGENGWYPWPGGRQLKSIYEVPQEWMPDIWQ